MQMHTETAVSFAVVLSTIVQFHQLDIGGGDADVDMHTEKKKSEAPNTHHTPPGDSCSA